jgi:cytidine deaminase
MRLGTHPSLDNAHLLVQAIDEDPYVWTKYGAVHSLLEMAACAEEESKAFCRASIVGWRRYRWSPLGQVPSATLYEGAPIRWEDRVRPLLRHAYELQEDEKAGAVESSNGSVRNMVLTEEPVTHQVAGLDLAKAAWKVRERARVFGKTQVGAAVLSQGGTIYTGCNVEHRFRSHDVHAEVNALTSMVAGGENVAVAIAIVSLRERFTPCGACMDWIFELGGPECCVYIATSVDAIAFDHSAEELMPFYPY